LLAFWVSATIALEQSPNALAQGPKNVGLTITEAAGIRRTEYPVSARVELPRGQLTDTDHVRLRAAGADLAAQYSIGARWDDQSIRILEVDFNVSVGPGETRAYQMEYGAGVNRAASVPRGLTLAEEADAIQVGNIRFSRDGSPLVLSANYRGEFMGSGANGAAILDTSGVRRDLSNAAPVALEVVKRGPLLVVLRYTGRIALDAGYSTPFTMTCEMPNSKSWLKTSIVVHDAGRRLKGLMFESPLTLGDKPWLWDFGTDSGTYGVFRNATDLAVLAQTVSEKGNRWTVQTGAVDELRLYESSIGLRVSRAAGWGHLVDATRAVAFAVDGFGSARGSYSISLSGQGQAVFSVTPDQPSTDHRLTVYQHFVSAPVAVGAATNPTAMLNPLLVTIK
jgi:hypothetical protein